MSQTIIFIIEGGKVLLPQKIHRISPEIFITILIVMKSQLLLFFKTLVVFKMTSLMISH